MIIYFGFSVGSGSVPAGVSDPAGKIGFDSARGEGEFALSLSAEKSAPRRSGRFLPVPPRALLAHERSIKILI